jgi:hypothetical protein
MICAMQRREFLAGGLLAGMPLRDGGVVEAYGLSGPCRWAAGELRNAIRERGLSGITVIAENGDERVSITPGPLMKARGVYSLLELADRVRRGQALLAVDERPATGIRGVMKCFTSDVEDKPWYNDRAMWPEYLTMLATQRFNRFNLAFGIGYDFTREIRDCYFHFAYPFLLDVPGYKVRAKGLPDAERDRNLEMLKFISDETARRGMRFQLGIWTHAYEWTNSPDANYTFEGLSAGNHAAYCRDALHQLLMACPNIGGVTFRIHGESGVAEGNYDFWKTVFAGIVKTGRKIEIDMHAKGMDDGMIETALATGMPLIISPKYIAEHMGLPYHQAGIRELEMPPKNKQDSGFFAKSSGSRSFLRYGYGDLLQDDRKYGVLHRIWPGTQRMLVWGDPVMAAGFGREAAFCGSSGLELFEPLSFKGRKGSGLPGGRCGYADASLAPKWDWQKFDVTCRVWGKQLYQPGSTVEVDAGLARASRILPLIANAHGPSAANNNYWPEMYTNMSIVVANQKSPYSDTPSPKRFGTVSPFDPELFAGVDEFAEGWLAGKACWKYSPFEVADWLDDLARAEAKGDRRIAEDVAIQCGIGKFFAAKFRSGVWWAVYEHTKDKGALAQAIDNYKKAREAWAALAERGKRVYREDVTYGWDAHSRGNWSNRLVAIDLDIAEMSKHEGSGAGRTWELPKRRKIAGTHTPPKEFVRGKTLKIEAKFGEKALLRYRHVNQSERFLETEAMEIPGDYTNSPFALMYYFVVGDSMYPGLDASLSNRPYFVVRARG